MSGEVEGRCGMMPEAKETQKKKPKPEPIPDLPAKKYESKEEEMTDFKEMLEEKILNHKMTWEEEIKELKYDVRFKTLQSVDHSKKIRWNRGEKKNVFQNFMSRSCATLWRRSARERSRPNSISRRCCARWTSLRTTRASATCKKSCARTSGMEEWTRTVSAPIVVVIYCHLSKFSVGQAPRLYNLPSK